MMTRCKSILGENAICECNAPRFAATLPHAWPGRGWSRVKEGALFGIARVSTLISRIADAIPGRLLIGFPGKHAGGVYRLLDARDGWN